MPRKTTNPLQKLVRGIIKESIEQINSSRREVSQTRKASKNQSKSKIKQKRTRHISTTVRYAVLNRDNNRCLACGATAKETQLQVDHIIPFSQGGSNEIDNLQTLCVDCNRGKSDRIFLNKDNWRC